MRGPKSPRPNSSRKGCWTCKRHHRTCDESKPSCQRCRQYAVECEGYGAIRVAFRPVKKSTSRSRRPSQPQSRGALSIISSPALSTATLLSSTSNSLIDSKQHALLHSFLHDFASLRSLSPLQNIFEEDIAPLALSHRHVRTAILAVASALQHQHRCRSAASPSSCQHVYQDPTAFQHYEDAVRQLRQSVDQFEQEKKINSCSKSSTEDMDACLAATYLLTWFEVLIYDPQKWEIHLKAVCSLINKSGPSLWRTTFGRRVLHAVARLDCQNALSNRGRPLLHCFWYKILESESAPHYILPETATDTPTKKNKNEYENDINDNKYTKDILEAIAVEHCRKLHGLLGASAYVSYEWTTNTPRITGDDLREQIVHVLHRLSLWYQSLPIALRWPGDVDGITADSDILLIPTSVMQQQHHICKELEFSSGDDDDIAIGNALRARSQLQNMILLHFYATRVHLYHLLDPVRTPRLMHLSIHLSQRCLQIIQSLDNRSFTSSASHMADGSAVMPFGYEKDNHDCHTQLTRYPSDMPVSFVFSIIGVLLRDASQREWICRYLMCLGREGIWCGYERTLCLRAWWKSEDMDINHNLPPTASVGTKIPLIRTSRSKRLIKSIPRRHELPNGSLTTWMPNMGMGVDIFYENLDTGETGLDRYYFKSCMDANVEIV